MSLGPIEGEESPGHPPSQSCSYARLSGLSGNRFGCSSTHSSVNTEDHLCARPSDKWSYPVRERILPSGALGKSRRGLAVPQCIVGVQQESICGSPQTTPSNNEVGVGWLLPARDTTCPLHSPCAWHHIAPDIETPHPPFPALSLLCWCP